MSICVVLCDVKVTSCLRMHAHSSHVCLYRKDSSQRRCVELSAQFRKYYFRTVRQVAAPEETFVIFNCPYNTHTHTHTHTFTHRHTRICMYYILYTRINYWHENYIALTRVVCLAKSQMHFYYYCCCCYYQRMQWVLCCMLTENCATHNNKKNEFDSVTRDDRHFSMQIASRPLIYRNFFHDCTCLASQRKRRRRDEIRPPCMGAADGGAVPQRWDWEVGSPIHCNRSARRPGEIWRPSGPQGIGRSAARGGLTRLHEVGGGRL